MDLVKLVQTALVASMRTHAYNVNLPFMSIMEFAILLVQLKLQYLIKLQTPVEDVIHLVYPVKGQPKTAHLVIVQLTYSKGLVLAIVQLDSLRILQQELVLSHSLEV